MIAFAPFGAQMGDWLTQVSQSLALGLTLSPAPQLGEFSLTHTAKSVATLTPARDNFQILSFNMSGIVRGLIVFGPQLLEISSQRGLRR